MIGLTLQLFYINRALGSHEKTPLHELHWPITIPDVENPYIQTHPTPLLIHQMIPPMLRYVVIHVPRIWNHKLHVYDVHPPNPFFLWVSHHGYSHQGDIGPKSKHVLFQQHNIVKDNNPMEPTTMHFFLKSLKRRWSLMGSYEGRTKT